MTADSRGGEIALHQVTFKLASADGAGTGWNTCGAFDQAVKWEFTDVSNPSTPLDGAGSWTFLQSDGSVCRAGGVVGFALLNLGGSVSIQAGETISFKLRLDTTGASSAKDDYVRVDLPSEREMDALAVMRDSLLWQSTTPVPGRINRMAGSLPITGGTLVY